MPPPQEPFLPHFLSVLVGGQAAVSIALESHARGVRLIKSGLGLGENRRLGPKERNQLSSPTAMTWAIPTCRALGRDEYVFTSYDGLYGRKIGRAHV